MRVAGIDRSAYHSVPPTRLEFNQYAVQAAVNAELLIFVPRAAQNPRSLLETLACAIGRPPGYGRRDLRLPSRGIRCLQ